MDLTGASAGIGGTLTGEGTGDRAGIWGAAGAVGLSAGAGTGAGSGASCANLHLEPKRHPDRPLKNLQGCLTPFLLSTSLLSGTRACGGDGARGAAAWASALAAFAANLAIALTYATVASRSAKLGRSNFGNFSLQMWQIFRSSTSTCFMQQECPHGKAAGMLVVAL